jgi:hypothetical protein
MSAEDIILESIKVAQAKGVRIIRGPLFSWSAGELPDACDCFGAVLIAHGKAFRDFPKGWLKELCEMLGKDVYWWWRFNYGFNQINTLILYREEKGQRIYFDDEVSLSAMRLAKRLGV